VLVDGMEKPGVYDSRRKKDFARKGIRGLKRNGEWNQPSREQLKGGKHSFCNVAERGKKGRTKGTSLVVDEQEGRTRNWGVTKRN